MNIHATCIDIDGKGILIMGKPGSGKSDLALRLIHDGARLVADDYVDLMVKKEQLLASCPRTIEGKMEVRGIGIVPMPFIEQSIIFAAIELVPYHQIDRMPDLKFFEYEGIQVPLFRLDAFSCSAVSKVKLITKLPITFFT